MTKKKLTVEDILSSINIDEKEIFVKEWNGTVTIKPFTKDEQQKVRKSATVDGEIDSDKLEMAMFVAGVCEPKFAYEDIPALKEVSANALDTVLKEIMSLSGISTEEEAKEIKKSST